MQLAEHFRKKDKRQADQNSQKHWFIKARQEQTKRDAIEDKLENDALAFAAEVAIATQIQIEEFEVKLDTYDEATIIALMENQEALDLINTQIQDLLNRAYVMEDGRRVFKTEDGTKVFDEFGQEVSRDELEFDRIDPTRPTWESFLALGEQREQLQNERGQILQFQEKVDAARDEISKDGVTEERLEALDAELLDALPPAVARHTPGYEPPAAPMVLQSEFPSSVKPAIEGRLDFSAPQAPQPGQ